MLSSSHIFISTRSYIWKPTAGATQCYFEFKELFNKVGKRLSKTFQFSPGLRHLSENSWKWTLCLSTSTHYNLLLTITRWILQDFSSPLIIDIVLWHRHTLFVYSDEISHEDTLDLDNSSTISSSPKSFARLIGVTVAGIPILTVRSQSASNITETISVLPADNMKKCFSL